MTIPQEAARAIRSAAALERIADALEEMTKGRAPSPEPWAAQLARVADAAKAEGYREGRAAAADSVIFECGACGVEIGEEWHRCPDDPSLSPSRVDTRPEATPEPAEPAGDEVRTEHPESAPMAVHCSAGNDRTAWGPEGTGFWIMKTAPAINPNDCGFFCHCAGPRPDVWQPGSVTR